MKAYWIALATLVVLILCVVAYSVITKPFTSATPPADLDAMLDVPPATENTAGLTSSSAPSPLPAATPQQPSDSISMEPMLKKLIGGSGAPVPGDLVTKPESCVFLGRPYRLAFLEAENLMLMINLAGIHAFDIVSGRPVWRRHIEFTAGQIGATFGHRQVLEWTNQEVHLLDATTGKKVWVRRDDRCGPMESALLSPDETQVVVVCKQGCILYTVADSSQHVLPRPANAWLCAWLPSDKTLFFAQQTGTNDYTIERLLLMNTDSGAVTTGCEPATSWEHSPPMLSAQGQFAEAAEDGDSNTTLTIRDGRTGKVLREFKGIPGRSKYFYWLQDARRLFSLTADRKQARVIDAETGAVQFSLAREGHRFSMYRLFEDASAIPWVFSQDEAQNWYVWLLAPDGTPRKVLDGGRIAPGSLRIHASDPSYVLFTRANEDNWCTHVAYALAGMRKVGEWRIHDPEVGWWFGPNLNKAMTHCIHFRSTIKYSPAVQREWNRPQNVVFSVNVLGKETAVRTGRGRPIAVSPDAKYLAVQIDDTTTCVYDVETNERIGQFSAPAREGYHLSMDAAFSDNGKRVVVDTSEAIEVMDLTGDYPRRPMITGGDERLRWGHPCLSPDGTRVLCGGYGGAAGLFDADTGTLLHHFDETEHFANRYGPGGGFWNQLAVTAQDWVGTITDRFKPGVDVDVAFADGGTRAITHAAGQIIRVWDTDSGQLLHTIHTGLPERRNTDGYIDNRIVLSATGRFAFCHNGNNFGIASLWSLADGTLQRRYRLPERARAWAQAAATDDGTAVYITIGDDLYRWPGVPIREK